MTELLARLDEEAIPERSPFYRLPTDSNCSTYVPVTWTYSDSSAWEELVALRPLLAQLRQVEAA